MTRLRFRFFQCALILGCGVLVGRLYYWQIVRSDELSQAAQGQYERTTTAYDSRGKILTADGFPLALNTPVFTLFVRPQALTESSTLLSQALAPLLYIPSQAASSSAQIRREQQALESTLHTRLSDKSRKWTSLAQGIDEVLREKILALKISALGFDAYERRYYPEGSVSAHLLGFVGKNSSGDEQGYFGIEGKYDALLRGKTTTVTRVADALGVPIGLGSDQEYTDKPTVHHIELTVQRDLQFLLENKIQEGQVLYGAREVDGIIMESKTGKILAMASIPSYFPDQYATTPQKIFKNPTVADAYEPGSTFKVITVASGIDAGVITETTTCDDCGGPKTIGKYTVRTWNNVYTKNIDMTQALVKSDNTAMMFVAKRLGKDRQLQYIKNFGIGERTGIDLQDESSPKLRETKNWSEIDLATASFGQGIALTMIQMINAVNVIATDGVLLRPYIAHKLITDTETQLTAPQVIRRVISPLAAQTVKQMMIQSASHGDAQWTLPAQYLIAGKTGTAQIPVAGHYDAERTIASFVGFAPADNPRFTMLIRVVEPTTSQWGSETAAPLWFSIAKDLFLKFGIQPKQVPRG